jgi:hypothetical protein
VLRQKILKGLPRAGLLGAAQIGRDLRLGGGVEAGDLRAGEVGVGAGLVLGEEVLKACRVPSCWARRRSALASACAAASSRAISARARSA